MDEHHSFSRRLNFAKGGRLAVRALCKMAIYHAAVRQEAGRGYARLRASEAVAADATDDGHGKDGNGDGVFCTG